MYPANKHAVIRTAELINWTKLYEELFNTHPSSRNNLTRENSDELTIMPTPLNGHCRSCKAVTSFL